MSIQISQNIATKFNCISCDYHTSNKFDYYKHLTTVKHKNNIQKPICSFSQTHDNALIHTANYKHKCNNCNKLYKERTGLWKHKKICKDKKELFELNYKLIVQLVKQTDDIMSMLNTNQITDYPVNNQLVNIIVDKINTIEELTNKFNTSNMITEYKHVNSSIIINNVVIDSRIEDNYVNATQLCLACNKTFEEWTSLETSKQFIDYLEKEVSQPLIDTQKDIFIHPDLAVQLTQWISPVIALQVNKWIRLLFSNSIGSPDLGLLEEQQKEITLKDKKIKLLEDAYIKKQQRKNYNEGNVIYMLTTEDNKNKRIYIIGKARNLKNRLSSYNKTAEHEVVYFKGCKNEDNLNTIEQMVLNKLNEYKEKANRDRFVLPLDKDISFFTNVIETCIGFFN